MKAVCFRRRRGRAFYEGTMPRIAGALERIALAIGKIADAQEQASREGVEPSRKKRAEPTKEVPTKTGEFLENLGGLEVSSTPELGNIWICAICGAEAQMLGGESTLSGRPAETPTGTANARVLVAGPEVLEALRDCVAAFERLKAECPKEWARIRSRAEHVAGDLGQAAHDAGTIIAMTTGKVVAPR